MFELFAIVTLSIAILMLVFRNNTINYILLVLYAIFQLLFTFYISKSFFQNTSISNYFWFIKTYNIEKYINADKYTIFFAIITSILFFFSSISSVSKVIFMKESNFSLFSSFLVLFNLSLFGVIASQNLIVLWVFIEATTLTGGVLIFQDRTKHSLEAAWKYLFVCSIGIALSFVGIIFLSLGYKSQSLSFIDLFKLKDLANPFWLELGFGFILIGFGTKAGLAPMHSWLPDAHSEAPSQVSALLSGALLNTAILGIIRVLNIFGQQVMESCKKYLLIVSLISLFVSSIYLLRSKNYKRMLAYSSIENISLISLGLSLGDMAMFASYLLIISHSLTKASLFLTSGVIKDIYHTVEIRKVNKLMEISPFATTVFALGFLSICGFPLFLSFISELRLVYYLLNNKRWIILIAVLSLLLIILFAISKIVFNILFEGESNFAASKLLIYKYRKLGLVNFIQIFSAFLMIITSFILGIFLPQNIIDFITSLTKGFIQ